jgi:hypothetical protein
MLPDTPSQRKVMSYRAKSQTVRLRDSGKVRLWESGKSDCGKSQTVRIRKVRPRQKSDCEDREIRMRKSLTEGSGKSDCGIRKSDCWKNQTVGIGKVRLRKVKDGEKSDGL